MEYIKKIMEYIKKIIEYIKKIMEYIPNSKIYNMITIWLGDFMKPPH